MEVCLPEEGDRVPDNIARSDHCGVGGEIENFTTLVFLTREFWSNFASGFCKLRESGDYLPE